MGSAWRFLRKHYLGAVTTVALGAAIAGSIAAGQPARLPAVALGSVALLDAERTTGLFAAFLLVALVIDQAWRGRLPSEISGRGVKYVDEVKDTTKQALEAVGVELEKARGERQALQDRLDALEAGE
jgi:hypothetical protein